LREAHFLAACLLVAAVAAADGGRQLVRQDAGPFRITVFTAPEPLAVGPADVSVLVQERGSGRVVLDAAVTVRLRPPGEPAWRRVEADVGSNRLLRSAALDLPVPGDWDLEVEVGRNGETAAVSATLPVRPPAPKAAAIWPYLAAPPLAIAFFAAGQGLRRRRRR
jgi:hypothetical protein